MAPATFLATLLLRVPPSGSYPPFVTAEVGSHPGNPG